MIPAASSSQEPLRLRRYGCRHMVSQGQPPLRPARVALLHGGGYSAAYEVVLRGKLWFNPVLWCGSCPFPQQQEIPRLFNFTNQYNFQKDLEARHKQFLFCQ